MLPIAALGMVLRHQVVLLLLGYGRFDASAVDLTAATLLLMLLGLPAYGMIDVIARSFYARQDTVTPVVAAIIGVVFTIALAVALVGSMGLPAVGLALSGGTWGEGLLLLGAIRRREPGLDLAAVGGVVARSLAGAALAALVGVVVVGVLGGAGLGAGKPVALVEAVLATAIGGGAYVAVAAILRVPELGLLIGTARTLLRDRRATG